VKRKINMKKEIIVEFERIRVIYNRRQNRPVRCDFCQSEVELLTLTEAGEIAGKDEQTVYEFVNRGKLHINRNSDNETLICLNSLLNTGLI